MKKYLHIAILMLILPHNGTSQIIDTLTRKEYNEYLITQKIDSLLNNSSSLNSLKKQCNLHERQLTFFFAKSTRRAKYLMYILKLWMNVRRLVDS